MYYFLLTQILVTITDSGNVEIAGGLKLPENTCVKRTRVCGGNGCSAQLCQSGEVVAGGGISCSGATNYARISRPTGDDGSEPSGWEGICTQSGASIYSICCKFK